jgi:hypothetical protein
MVKTMCNNPWIKWAYCAFPLFGRHFLIAAQRLSSPVRKPARHGQKNQEQNQVRDQLCSAGVGGEVTRVEDEVRVCCLHGAGLHTRKGDCVWPAFNLCQEKAPPSINPTIKDHFSLSVPFTSRTLGVQLFIVGIWPPPCSYLWSPSYDFFISYFNGVIIYVPIIKTTKLFGKWWGLPLS